MATEHRIIFAKVGVCALLLATTATAQPQSGTIGGVTGGDAVAIGFAIAAIGAGIGIGAYFAFHHGNSLTGCTVSGCDGSLQLRTKGEPQTFDLIGDVSAIKPGERVRVAGKRQKKSSGAAPQFLVEGLKKDYGGCRVESAATSTR